MRFVRSLIRSFIAAPYEAYGPEAPPERRAILLLCSHRLAAFPRADRVIVLDRGRIIEEGTHEPLLAEESLYARIFKAQHRIDEPSTPEQKS